MFTCLCVTCLFIRCKTGSVSAPVGVKCCWSINGAIRTRGLAAAPVRLQRVPVLAVASEGASLIEAVLTAQTRRFTLVHVLARLRVVTELEPRGTRTLGPERALDAAVGATGIVIAATLLIWRGNEGQTFSNSSHHHLRWKYCLYTRYSNMYVKQLNM